VKTHRVKHTHPGVVRSKTVRQQSQVSEKSSTDTLRDQPASHSDRTFLGKGRDTGWANARPESPEDLRILWQSQATDCGSPFGHMGFIRMGTRTASRKVWDETAQSVRLASRQQVDPRQANPATSSSKGASAPRRFAWFATEPFGESNIYWGGDDSTRRSKHSQFGIWHYEQDVEQRHPPRSTLHLNRGRSPQKSTSTHSNLKQNPNSESRSVKRG
jgi:hypothetical protein